MFHVFPRAVPKKECERLLDYCIKNTNFSEASVLNKGEYDVDSENFGSGKFRRMFFMALQNFSLH